MHDVASVKAALPYIRRFKDKIFVLKMGGESAKDAENLDYLAEDISLLHHVSIKIVIVHGGGPQADELLDRLGIERKFVNGRRITDDKTLDVAKMIFSGKVNIEIAAALRKWGVRTAGLSGVDGNIIQAKRRGITAVKNQETGETINVDFGFVGDIVKVDTSLVTLLLEKDYLPVVCSLSSDDDGTIFNINADTVATAIAQSLKAEKLIVLSDVPGLLADEKDPTSLISYVDISDLEKLVAERKVGGGMLPKIESCIAAVKNGVSRTHIIDGTREHALLEEVFTNAGSGTMIVDKRESETYEEAEIP